MSNPAFELIGLDALRNDPRYIDIDGDAPDRDGNGQPDRLTVVVIDTGIDTEHSLLSENVVAYVDFIDDEPVVTNQPPTIASGTAFDVPENAIDVGSVIATDPESSAITYSIVGGADANRLSIDSVTGALSFLTTPDFESPVDADGNNVYAIQIQVSDGQNSVPQDLTVTVTDVNEVPANLAPSFSSSATFSLPENTTAVGTVAATDLENDALSYSISGGNDQNRFTIDASTGVLSFISAPDFESPQDAGRDNIYNLQVSVTDGQNTVNQDIAVTVNDVNDRTLLSGVLSDNNDPDGHGTHVAGIIGSTDPDIGVANNVDLIGLRVLGEGQDGSEVTEALQWVLDNRSEYNIVAVNMSLGISSAFYTQRPDEGTSDQGNLQQADPVYSTWRRLIEQLEDAGITVVSAAGNNYAENQINPNLRENISIPAIASTAAVGAVWQDGSVTNARWSGSQDTTTGADRLVSFSQRLSTYNGMLFAPGAVIESTLPGDQIGGLAGTSMAAPMVSGTVALMQDAALTFGDRLLTPDEIRQILIETADTVVDGDDEDTNVTASGNSYLRIDVYDAVQAVDRLFTGNITPTDGDQQFFCFVFNSSLQPEDSYQGYGYADANRYQVGDLVSVNGGTYTITQAVADQSGTAGTVVVTDYYDGSTGFGYAIYVDAIGNDGLGSESGFAYDGNFGGVDTSFSANDTADLQAAPTVNQLYYFTYTYRNGDSYQGYGYAAAGTYTLNQVVSAAEPNELGLTGQYTIDSVYEDNYGAIGAVTVYSYFDGADGNGDEAGGGYGYASSVSGYGSAGLGSEAGYAYDYNFASVDAFFSQTAEANLFDGVIIDDPTTQVYYYTYTYGNGDFYQGYGYAAEGTYTSGQIISAAAPNDALNELGLSGQYTGQYTIDSVYDDSYGFEGEIYVYSYYDGADGNGDEAGGEYGYASDVYGYGFGGLGTESGYAYDYNYVSTDVFFSSVDEANLTSQIANSQIYSFTYTYGNGDYYQGYGYAAADTYTLDQIIPAASPNELGLTGQYTIDSVYDSFYNYNSNDVYVTRYYDGGDGNGEEPGGSYGFAYSAYGYGVGLGNESGFAYDNNYLSTDTFFDSVNEANLVASDSGFNQLYYFTYNYGGNGDFYQGYGYAQAGTYTQGQQIEGTVANETGEIGYYSIDATYTDSFGYLDSVYVNYYYDADTGYGSAIFTSGYGYFGLGSESGNAYDADYLSTDTYFSNFNEVDLLVPSGQNQLYYFTYYYGEGDSFDYYDGYGYAAAGTYTLGQRIDQTSVNETGGTGYYEITSVSDISYGFLGQVSVYNYNDVDTGYGPAFDVFAEGYSGLGSEFGYAYDYNYASLDNTISNFYEADLDAASATVDLYYFTYNYGNGDFYQGYGYAEAGTYSLGQRITLANETGSDQTGYYKITDVYANSYASSTDTVYVYNYYDGDTGYGWAWSAWGEGYAGLGSESGYAYDYNYITTDPFFGNGGDSTFYEADLLINFGTDTNPTLSTATNLGVISERTLSVLDNPSTANFNLGSDPDSNGPVPADVDMYRFELTQNGIVSLETSLPAGGVNMDTILRLFDAFGNELGTDDDTGLYFYSRINAYLEAGSYYFGVSGYANFSYSPNSANSGITGSNGDYAVSIAFDPDDTPFVGDPNGTATGARDIGALSRFASFGGADVPSIIGLDTFIQNDDPNTPDVVENDPFPENLASVGSKDVDLIKFTAEPGLVIFQTSDYIPDYIGKFGAERGQAYLDLLDSDRDGHFDDSIDTVLRLFDASGNELAIDDDGGEGVLSRLEYVFTESGTYYLGTSGYGNSSYNINTLPADVDTDPSRYSGSTGSSLLSIILQPNTAPQDPNGVFYGAIPVDLRYGSNLTLSDETIGTDILAGETIEVTSGDVDLYRFTANETGVILIDLDTPSSNSLDTYLRVFDANGIALPSPSFDDNSVAEDFSRNPITEAENKASDSFVRLDVTEGNTYYVGVSASGNQTYNLNSLDNRTNPSTGEYQINLQYGGGATNDDNDNITDADGHIHAELPSFDLSATDTGNRNITSLQRHIGNDEQVGVGATDVDFVKVFFQGDNATPRILTATTQGNRGAADNTAIPTVYVFDGAGNELAASTLSSGINTVQIVLDAGTDYYVGVAGYGNEAFNPLIMSSGQSGSEGSYTIDLSLSGTERDLLSGILNAANQRGTLYGNSLDFDIDLYGTGTPRSYTLSTTPRTILASLGEDIDQVSATAQETNAFGRLYLAAQGLTGTAAEVTATSSDVGADDVDIYPINITEAGIYQFTTSGTGNAIDDARPTLKLFDSTGTAVALTNYGSQGLVTGNVLADLAVGSYSFVVMSTGFATEQFSFGSDPGFTPQLEEAPLREFYQNTGNYQLDMVKVSSLAQPVSVVDGTSLSQQFSLPLDVASLELYGASGVTPSLSVTAPNGAAVTGSLVYDEDNRTLRFVPTNPELAAGTYTINYTDLSDFQAEGADLDANAWKSDLTSAPFTVEAADRVVYLPSFARGPGQTVDIGGQGIPVNISDTDGLTNIRITVDYDPDALNVTGAELAAGLTGWELVGTPTISNGRITVDIRDITDDGVANPLPAGDREVIRLIADVPANAVFNSAEVLEVTAGARAGSRTVTIADSTAVQKVAFFADTNGNGRVNAADAVSILRLAAGLGTGFGIYDLVDPNLISDTNGNGRSNAADAVNVLRFAAGLNTPTIPVVPNPSLAVGGLDPTIAILGGTGNPGDVVSVTLAITGTEPGADTLAGYGLRITFDTSILDIVDSTASGDSLNVVPNPTAGFTVIENVNDGLGTVILVGAGTGTSLTTGLPLTLATIDFTIKDSALAGTTALSLDLAPNNDLTDADDNVLTLTPVNGAITIAGAAGNTDPTITDVANQTINQDTATSELTFTIGDAETPVGALTVAGASNNPTLVANSNIVIGGAGADRTVTVTPVAGQTGTATITLTVTDADGATDTDTFDVTVNPVAAVVPTVTIAATDANAAEVGVDPGQFTVTLSEAAAEDITVTYTVGANSTATPTSDYTALSGTVTIAANATTATIAVIPVDDAITDEGNESVILTLTGGATYDLGATITATVTIADNDVAASPVDIDGNGTVSNADVFLINQYLLLEGNGNRDSLLQSTFELFNIEGATNETGSELSTAIGAQINLFDIDDNGRTTGSDVFLINQYLLLEGNSNRNSILEQTAIAFGNDLNGPINTGTGLSAALSSLVG